MNSLHECRSSVTGLHESCGTAEPHNNDLPLCAAAEETVTTAASGSTTVTTHSGRDVPSGARCFRLLRYCPATEKVHEEACRNTHDATITSEKVSTSSCSCAPQLTTLSLDALSPVTGPDERTAGASSNSGAASTSSVHGVYALLTFPTRPMAVTEMKMNDHTKGVALPLTHDPLCPFSPQPMYDTTPTSISTTTTTSTSTKMTEVASLLWPPATETQVIVVSPDRLPQSASGSHFDNAGGSLDESSAATVLTSSMVLSSESSMQTTATAKEGVVSVMECAGKATHWASRSPARHDVPGEHYSVQNGQAVWRGEQGVHPHHNNLHEGNINTSSISSRECAGNSSSKPVLRFPAQIGVALPLSDAVLPGAKGGVAVRSMWSSAPRSGPRRKTTTITAANNLTDIAATRLGKPGSVEVTQSCNAAPVQPAVVNKGPGDDNPNVTTKQLSPLLHCRLATPSSPSSAAVLGWKAPSPASIASPRETHQNINTFTCHRRMEDNNNNNSKECVALSLDEHDEKSVQTLREGSSSRLKESRVPTLCATSAAHTSPRHVCSASGATQHTDPQPEVMNSVASSPRLATITSPPRKEETHHRINAAAPIQQPFPVLPKATLSLALAVDISKRSGNVRTLLTHYMNYERELLWQRLCEHHPCLAPLSSFSTARDGQLLSLSLRASLLRLYFQSFHDAMRRLRVQADMSALVAAQRFASGAALRAAALVHATHACTSVPHNTTALSRNVFLGAVATQQTMSEGFMQVPPAVKGLEHVFSDLLCRNVSSDAAGDTSRTPQAAAAVCAGQPPPPLSLRKGNNANSVSMQPATMNATMLLNLQELRRYVKLDAEYFTSQDNNTSNALSSAGVERRLSEQDSLRLVQLRELQRSYGALRAQSAFLQRYLPEYIDTTRLVRWLRATGDDMGTTVKVMQYEMWTNAHEIATAISSTSTNKASGTITDVEVMPQQTTSRTNVTQSTTTTTTTTSVMTPEAREQLRRCVVQMERDEESMQWSVGLEEAIRKRRLCPEAALDLIHCLENDPNTVVQLWYSAEGEVMNMFRLLLYTLRPRAAK